MKDFRGNFNSVEVILLDPFLRMASRNTGRE